MAVIEDVARALLDAHTTGMPIPPVRDRISGVDEAYAVQRRTVDTWIGQGRDVAGHKIGLTAKAVQAQLGVDQPDFGTLFSDMILGEGEEIGARAVLQPRVEAEIAFVLKRDLIGTRLLELTFDAPRRLQMLHGDAHPGNFMLLPDGRMVVIDFGAVAPMPGGFPIELGMTIRLARDKNYDLLLPTMEKAGFIQKGQEVSVRDIDDMLRQYVEPVEVEVFHYTRKWLQKMSAIEIDRSVSQIRTARQMDLPPKLVIPMRVIMSVAAILCQLDAHVPIKALSEELVPGFAEPDSAVV